jgi:hypothetical protein
VKSTETTLVVSPHDARDVAPFPPIKPISLAFSLFASTPYASVPATTDRAARKPGLMAYFFVAQPLLAVRESRRDIE